jgi:uncharacterized membrane protein YbhN (UPF0104 family)
VVEVVLIATLSAAGGDQAKVAAAVLVYRALTWGLPILAGIATYLWWRRRSLLTPTHDRVSTTGAQPPAQ